jgi:hypothetical protein
MFEGKVETSERINLLYDVTRHYHVIGNLKPPWPRNCVRRVARDVVETSCIHVIKHVAIAWRVLRVYSRGFEFLTRTVIDIFEVSHVSPIIRWKEGTRRVFVNANASARHVMNSSFLVRNMNAPHISAKHVKRIKRDDISAICNHWRTCWHQAIEYCRYSMILKLRSLHDTLILPGKMSLFVLYTTVLFPLWELWRFRAGLFRVWKKETWILEGTSGRHDKLSSWITPLV